MLEREFMRKWVAERKKLDRHGYWLRLPDTSDGIKPFDGVWFAGSGKATAIEFKVWRYAGAFDGSTVEPHQMRELLQFRRPPKREAWIVVYFDKTGDVRKFLPSEKLLKKMLESRVPR